MTEQAAHHVGITVADLDRAVSFYRDTLELPLIAEFSVGGDAFSTGVGIPGARADFAHLDAGAVRLELVSYDSTEESTAASSLDHAGAAHFGLTVDDVAAYYDALPDEVETLSEPQTTESGTTIFFIRDPEGNLIEILSN